MHHHRHPCHGKIFSIAVPAPRSLHAKINGVLRHRAKRPLLHLPLLRRRHRHHHRHRDLISHLAHARKSRDLRLSSSLLSPRPSLNPSQNQSQSLNPRRSCAKLGKMQGEFLVLFANDILSWLIFSGSLHMQSYCTLRLRGLNSSTGYRFVLRVFIKNITAFAETGR